MTAPLKIAALCALTLVSALGFAHAEPSPEPLMPAEIVADPARTLLDSEGAGKLYQVGTHLVCVLEGTPAEMGRQHGRLLAPKIRQMLKEGYVAKTVYGQGYARDYVDAQAKRMEAHFPPEYTEELNGVIEGLRAAGIDDVSYGDIRNALAMPEIQHHKPGAPPACTNFAVYGKWTRGGRLLHGRNLDWTILASAQDVAVVVIWRPKGGTPFVMPGWAGVIGGVGGMNAHGITLGEMTSSSTDETFDGLPLLLTMRRALERAATLDDAVAILRDSPRTLGWNYVAGDAKTPAACAVEVDAKETAVFTPDDPKETEETASWAMADAVRRTNHPCGPVHFKKAGVLVGKELGIDLSNPDTGRLVLMQQESWRRYDWLGRRILEHPGGIDVPEALALLGNGPVKVDNTLHSWVFDPSQRVLYLAVAPSDPPKTATSVAYTRIDLQEWLD